MRPPDFNLPSLDGIDLEKLADDLAWMAQKEAHTVEMLEVHAARLPDTLWPLGVTQAKAAALALAQASAISRQLAALKKKNNPGGSK